MIVVLIFLLFVCYGLGKSKHQFHHFDSYVVHLIDEGGNEQKLHLRSENEVSRVEEEHGRENVRRSYLSSGKYEKYIRRAIQSNEHDSGLVLRRWQYEEVHEILRNLSDSYTHCSYGVIGKSSGGRDVYYMRVGTPSAQYDLKPEFKLVANIHGDEIVGLVLAVQFAHYLCSFYPSNDRVRKMLEEINVYIIPSMNPDGYVLSKRSNHNGYDLNRNFPDQFRDGTTKGGIQPENVLMMKFTEDKNIVLGAHFHGGAQVVSYPWDGIPGGRFTRGTYSASPDDDLFKYISHDYASKNPQFHASEFPTGVTNGAEWYTLYGGIQDWEYLYRGISSVTIELSNNKQPSNTHLNEFWNANFEALMTYVEFTYKLGVRGIVTNSTGHPVGGAEVHVYGNDHVVKTSKNGRFTRLLAPGKKYTVGVTMPGKDEYKQQWVEVDLSEEGTGQVDLSFKLSNVTSGRIPGEVEGDGEKKGTLMKYLGLINTGIAIVFCCCCCCCAGLLYCCFITGCVVANSRKKLLEEPVATYIGMPTDDDDDDDADSEVHGKVDEDEDVVDEEGENAEGHGGGEEGEV